MKRFIIVVVFLLLIHTAFAQVPPPPAASQAEVNAGVLKTKYVSPATLAGASFVATPGTLAGSVPSGIYLQNLAGAWSANTFASNADGTAITVWPDLSGNGNNLQCTLVTYQHNAVNGNAGLYFAYGSSYATNANFLSNYAINTNFTIIAVIRDTSGGGGGIQNRQGWFFSVGAPGGNGSFRWFDYNAGNGNVPGNEGQLGGNFTIAYGAQMNGNVDVMAFSGNPSFFSFWQNGVQEVDTRWPDNQTPAPGTGIGTTGSLYLGSLPGPSGNFGGYVSLLLVYTNWLTPQQVQQDNSVLCAAYGQTGNAIMLSGDSVTEANSANTGTNFTAFAVDSFPGWNVFNCGRPGMNSSNQTLYAYNWAPNMNQSAALRVDLFMERINDDSQGLSISTTLTNWIEHAAVDHSNNVKFIACTIPSYNTGDLNGTRTNFNNLLRTTWRTFADGLCDYASVPSMGTNFACSNTVLFSAVDLTHPTSTGYQQLSNVEVQAIQQLLWPNANQVGVFYSSNNLANLQWYTNQIPVWGTLIIYTNAPAATTSGAAKLYNSNGLITLTPGT